MQNLCLWSSAPAQWLEDADKDEDDHDNDDDDDYAKTYRPFKNSCNN